MIRQDGLLWECRPRYAQFLVRATRKKEKEREAKEHEHQTVAPVTGWDEGLGRFSYCAKISGVI